MNFIAGINLERCLDIKNFSVTNLEQYIVDCSNQVDWRNDFLLGLGAVLFALLFILGILQLFRSIR